MESVTIDARAGKRLQEGHPWVFSNHVRDVTGAPSAGEVVHVVQGAVRRKGKDLGTAFYNPHSLIALRHLSSQGDSPDRAFFIRRLRDAQRLREPLFPDSDAWRLSHGESDLLPGLVIERFGDVYVLQSLSAGMDRLQGLVAEVLVEEFGARSVIERNDSHLRRLEGLATRSGLLEGEEPARVTVRLPPVTMSVDPLHGQKTGLFLDQRENHVAAARHAAGMRVYDGHCNAGGFGIHAALAGAEAVVGVDSSTEALELARANAELNGVEGVCVFEEGDVLKDMTDRHRRKERFGLVVVDPPSYTRSRKQVPQARRALRELNRRAITLLAPGGVLVSSCCSHHVREETFVEQLLRAAQDAERRLRILERRSQAPDHPVIAAMPESRYLSCVIADVI